MDSSGIAHQGRRTPPVLGRSQPGRWGPSTPAALLLALGGLASCHEPPAAIVTGPDVVPPAVHILAPVPGTYDTNGDSLLDFVIQWSDARGAVDVNGVRAWAVGGAGDSVDLLTAWQVERLDSAGLVLHETLDRVLGSGVHRLVVLVPDTAGNTRVDTATVTLPAAAFFRTLSSGLPFTWQYADGIVLCEDDNTLYMADVDHVVVADPESLRIDSVVPSGTTLGKTVVNIGAALCLPGDPYVYFGGDGRVKRLDRRVMDWDLEISNTLVATALVASRQVPRRVYMAWNYLGTIGIVDLTTGTTVGQLLAQAPASVYVRALAVLDHDAKIYAASGNVLVIDPAADSVLRRVGSSVDVSDLAISADDSRLYAAITFGNPAGIGEIDTGTDQILRVLPINGTMPIHLALSPDGRRMFVTGLGAIGYGSNALVDIPTWQVIAYLPRSPAPGQTTRYDRGVVFRGDGRLAFVARDRDLDVYLVRP